nr:MAG TPA: hypothetical protein [Caudoviricetes sp.]
MILDARLIRAFQQQPEEEKLRTLGGDISTKEWINFIIDPLILRTAKHGTEQFCYVDIPEYIDIDLVIIDVEKEGYLVERDSRKLKISW